MRHEMYNTPVKMPSIRTHISEVIPSVLDFVTTVEFTNQRSNKNASNLDCVLSRIGAHESRRSSVTVAFSINPRRLQTSHIRAVSRNLFRKQVTGRRDGTTIPHVTMMYQYSRY